MDFGQVFDAGLPRQQRAFVQGAMAALRAAYPRLELAAAGNYELAHSAVAAGYAPEQITVTGWTLPAAVVGQYASGREANRLGVEFTGELEPFNDLVDGDDGFGAILVGYHAAQLQTAKHHERILFRSLIADRAGYASATQRALCKVAEKISGIEFRLGTAWDAVAAGVDDPRALVVVNPPRTTDGVTAADKRARGQVEWPDQPAFAYKPVGDVLDLAEETMACAGCGLMLCNPLVAGAHDDRVVFAHEQRADRVEYAIVNRPELLRPAIVNRPETRVCAPLLPLIDGHAEVTAASTLAFVPTTREVAMYLRDLWAHKLGATRSETYFLFVVDGHAAGVFGMFFDHLHANRLPTVMETFGFNAPLAKHRRLNNLMMRCLVSGQARAFFAAAAGTTLLDLTEFQTTCISSVPELKTNRGILKLVERRLLPAGRYYLNYAAPFTQESFADCLRKWLAKDGKVKADG
jgi:hypothetical protein